MTSSPYEYIHQHHGIEHEARRIMTHGVAPEPEAEEDQPRLDADAAIAQWQNDAPEHRALTAVLTDLIVDRALQQRHDRGPYGLVHAGWSPDGTVTDVNRVSDIEKHMEHTLLLACGHIREELTQSTPDAPHVGTYRRYRKLQAFAETYEQELQQKPITLEEGIHTAAQSMTASIRNIISLLRRYDPDRTFSINDLVKNLEYNWPYVAHTASVHRHELKFTSREMADHELVPVRNMFRLQHTHKAQEEKERSMQDSFIPPYDQHPTYRCPGMVNFGSGSAIKKLWDWHINIVTTMYKRQYANDHIYRLYTGKA